MHIPARDGDNRDGGSDGDDTSDDEEAGTRAWAGTVKQSGSPVASEARHLRAHDSRAATRPADGPAHATCAHGVCQPVQQTAWHGWSAECLSRRLWYTFAITQALPQVLAVGLEEWQVGTERWPSAAARTRGPHTLRCCRVAWWVVRAAPTGGGVCCKAGHRRDRDAHGADELLPVPLQHHVRAGGLHVD